MSPSPNPSPVASSLKDYAQHKPECESIRYVCHFCGDEFDGHHARIRNGLAWHEFDSVAADAEAKCSCGLDALLTSPSSRPPEGPAPQEEEKATRVDRQPGSEGRPTASGNEPPRRFRTKEQLQNTLSMLCHFVWNRTVRPGEHMWSIPVDRERDFDCILSDAIDELVEWRERALSAVSPAASKPLTDGSASLVSAVESREERRELRATIRKLQQPRVKSEEDEALKGNEHE